MDLATEHDMRYDACELLVCCMGCMGCMQQVQQFARSKLTVLVMAVGALHTLPLPGSNTVRWISFTEDIDHVQVPCVANLHN